eukprot:6194026-Pleurochrysis_carterae.AAC.2
MIWRRLRCIAVLWSRCTVLNLDLFLPRMNGSTLEPSLQFDPGRPRTDLGRFIIAWPVLPAITGASLSTFCVVPGWRATSQLSVQLANILACPALFQARHNPQHYSSRRRGSARPGLLRCHAPSVRWRAVATSVRFDFK